MRVALVYDRLNKIGGAEQVLQAFHTLFPDADWYTSVWDPSVAKFSRNWRVYPSWLNRVAFFRKHHEWIPFLMPFVFEAFNFNQYDLVVSIGSAESKGVITGPNTYHLHYSLTPTRYLYSHQHEYLTNPLYRLIAKYLRAWDQVASTRADEMIAISTQVKNRIKKIYNRDSQIIFPPVDTRKYSSNHPQPPLPAGLPKDYFLVVSRLVPYKKIDILIRAANLTKQNLVIIGIGSEMARLRQLAGPTVWLLGYIKDIDLPAYYSHCRAYLQANEEDFGIAMCEAGSAGKPVIAYGRGGARDIVIPGKTGILLETNTVAEFAKALREFDTIPFVPTVCKKNATRFDIKKWQQQMKERINQSCQINQM